MESSDKISLLLETIGAHDVDPDLLVRLQAVIFASEFPVTMRKLKEFFEEYELDQIERALVALFSLHEAMGIQLNRVGGGYLFTTAAACGNVVRAFMGTRSNKLTGAALETLAIVAYMQPCTLTQINEIRGVNSDSSLKLLADRGLVKTVGRKNEPGRPILYGTTREFLTFFNLNSIAELPELKEEDRPEVPEEEGALSLLKDLITSSRQAPVAEDPKLTESFDQLDLRHREVEAMELQLMTALGMQMEDASGEDDPGAEPEDESGERPGKTARAPAGPDSEDDDDEDNDQLEDQDAQNAKTAKSARKGAGKDAHKGAGKDAHQGTGKGAPEGPGEDDPEETGEDDPEGPGEDGPEETGEDDPEAVRKDDPDGSREDDPEAVGEDDPDGSGEDDPEAVDGDELEDDDEDEFEDDDEDEDEFEDDDEDEDEDDDDEDDDDADDDE